MADPGFPRGGINPGGREPTCYLATAFAEKCMKMEEFGPGVGGRPCTPPPTGFATAKRIHTPTQRLEVSNGRPIAQL